ncbi:MAG: hypothetical protein ACRC0X_07000 [Brevinema sp.]
MLIIFLFLLLPIVVFADTRTNNLPQGFQWRYTMDEREPSPRFGQFWRDGIFLEDKIIVLNTHTLIALDFQGQELWKMGLAAESPFSEAKIHHTDSNEIVVVITDALLRINTDTGELIDHYGYDVRRRAAFQFTELLPRSSVLLGDYIYVFLGPQLLSFHKKDLKRESVLNFHSSPKTIPIIYDNQLIIGLLNGFVELFNPQTKEKQTLIYGKAGADYSVRQIVVHQDFIFIPSNQSLQVYSNTNFFAESDLFPDNILSSVDNQIWLRQHQEGTLYEIDETLSALQEIEFITDKSANQINSPLAGNSNILLHIDGIEGRIFVIRPHSSSVQVIYSEHFLDNPPLQLLDQQENFILLGGFDGLYLINLIEL